MSRDPLDVARELEVWADFGSPAAPSEQSLREGVIAIRQLHAEVTLLRTKLAGKKKK